MAQEQQLLGEPVAAALEDFAQVQVWQFPLVLFIQLPSALVVLAV